MGSHLYPGVHLLLGLVPRTIPPPSRGQQQSVLSLLAHPVCGWPYLSLTLFAGLSHTLTRKGALNRACRCLGPHPGVEVSGPIMLLPSLSGMI